MSSWSLYPEMLEVIQIYIKHLNNAEKEIQEISDQSLCPGISKIPLQMDGIRFGNLVDEIGGEWAYEPIDVG